MNNSNKIHVFYDNGTSDIVSILDWADFCSIFFISLSIYPPYHYARRFSNSGLMNHGMSGYLEWIGFDLTWVMYDDLFHFFKVKNERLIACGDDQGLEVESDIDLVAWRYNIAFGIPYREHQILLEECSKLEREFRAALDLGESKKAYSIYANLERAKNKRDCFVKSYTELKK